MPAPAIPPAMYAASSMWSTSAAAAGFSMAAIGSTSTTRPPITRKPAGVFIQAFAVTTNMPETAPEIAISTPANKWARGLMRSHPNR